MNSKITTNLGLNSIGISIEKHRRGFATVRLTETISSSLPTNVTFLAQIVNTSGLFGMSHGSICL